MDFLVLLGNETILRPLVNGLLLLYIVLFSSFGSAIIALTIIIRLITFPLMRRQLRQTQKMQSMQARVKALQEQFKNDPKRRSQEVMRLYKDMGVNPIGCLGPFAIQMPILIGLFFAIRTTIGLNPEDLAGLASKLYSWLPMLDSVVPLDREFLWLDLGERDPSSLLPLLSGASMWVQQKMSMVPNADPSQQGTQRMMLWMFPIFFVIISLNFFSGLVLYWVVSNVIGIVIQYLVSGWGGLRPSRRLVPALGPTLGEPPPGEELGGHEQRESDANSEDGGRGDRDSTPRARRRPKRGRGRRS
jgi:YidC/Oxa1 family membrane protein insertase